MRSSSSYKAQKPQLLMRLKYHATELFGSLASALGAITSRQVEFDYWFRQLGTAVALIAGLFTVAVIIRKEFPEYLPNKFRRPVDRDRSGPAK